MRFLFVLLLLSACSSDRREYMPPSPGAGAAPMAASRASQSGDAPLYEKGEVLRFTYADSPGAGEVTAEFLGNMLMGSLLPLNAGPNVSHIPTYHIRLDSGRIVHVRDDMSQPLVRGSRVVLLKEGAGYRIIPDRLKR